MTFVDFSLNETTGELSVAEDLMRMAREEPYALTAMATDGGDLIIFYI